MAQQQFDINKRLMTLLKNEIRAANEMNSCTKQSTKQQNNIASVKETVEQQKRAYEKTNSLILKRRKDLEACEALIEAVQELVTAAKQRNDALRQRLTETKQQHDQYRGFFRVLCETTNTYLNASKLPARMKGVTVSRDGDQWQPFDIATSDLKGLSMLWNRFQCDSHSVHADKWQQLLQVGSNPLSANVTTSSIIEIDLTSPQSQR